MSGSRPPGEPAHPTRTTVLLGVALAVLLLVAYAVTAGVGRPADAPVPAATPVPSSAPPADPPSPRVPDPTPTAGVPHPGARTPTRDLGSLRGRSVITSGQGPVALRYVRAPHSATRVHLICTGCDADTWLVELPRDRPVAADGPLLDPSDATGVADTLDPGSRSVLFVRAAADASWTVTLTPFDELPVHQATFDALDADVVAVRASGALTLTCGGAYSYRTFARGAGRTEYGADELGGEDRAGTATLHPARGTDLLVLDVGCPGRWTVTVP